MVGKLKDNLKSAWFRDVNGVFGSGLSKHAILVRLYLARCADQESQAFPGLRNIAKNCGLSKPTVVKALNELESSGWITRQRRTRDDGGQSSTLYTLLCPIGDGAVKPFNRGCEGHEQGVLSDDTAPVNEADSKKTKGRKFNEPNLLKDGEDPDIEKMVGELVLLYAQFDPVSGKQAAQFNSRRNKEITAALRAGASYDVVAQVIRELAAVVDGPWEIRKEAVKRANGVNSPESNLDPATLKRLKAVQDELEEAKM